MVWQVGATPPLMDGRGLRRVQRPKSPTDATVVDVDFSRVLTAAIKGDTIAQVVQPILTQRNDGGTDNFMAIAPAISTDGNRISLWLTGGTGGFEYLVSVRVISKNSQDITRSFIMPIMAR